MIRPNYLFVYGTLRRNIRHPMAELLATQAIYEGVGTFQGRLYDLGPYPGVIVSANPNDIVQGDLYRLKNTLFLLQQLDHYEGYRPGRPAESLYLRQAVSITRPTGDKIQAWIYLYNRPVKDTRWIKSGYYLHYLENSKI